MASLAGKVIAITGAARGIALSTAQLLASRGATLSLADTNQQGLDEAIKTLTTSRGGRHTSTVVDVRDSKAVDGWVAKTVADHGRLDAAANIAGVYRNNVRLVDETDEGFHFHMDVNSTGLFYCLRAQLQALSKGGSIVNVASAAGHVGVPGIGSYVASKHAVLGLTRTAAKEHPEHRINAVAPGIVATPMVKETEKIQGYAQSTKGLQVIDRQAQPGEIASVIAFLLSDEASFVTGATYNVDGGCCC